MSKKDIFGKAMWDFISNSGRTNEKLWARNNINGTQLYPVSLFYRSYQDMSALEKKALDIAQNNVLVVGGGTGTHIMELQNKCNVTAIDISTLCCKIMKIRGVKNVICDDFYNYISKDKYDYILLLMNGLGIAKNVDNFPVFLDICKSLLYKKGAIITDTSDISYFYENDILPSNKYYGEMKFRWEYKKEKSSWFEWLYLDEKYLNQLCEEQHWSSKCLFINEDNTKLYKLKPYI